MDQTAENTRPVRMYLTHDQHRFAKWFGKKNGIIGLHNIVRRIVQDALEENQEFIEAMKKEGE
jgi:hypothetical protein